MSIRRLVFFAVFCLAVIFARPALGQDIPPVTHNLEIINIGVPSNIVEVPVGVSPPNT